MEWRSVNNKPKLESFYLVYVHERGVFMMYYGMYNDKENGWFYNDDFIRPYMQPSHWMELPDPPKL